MIPDAAARKTVVVVALVALVALSGCLNAQAEDDAEDGQEGTCDGPQDIRARQIKFHILVEWEEWSFARAYEVYRAVGDGAFVQVGVTNGDNPEDGDADEPHTTHFLDDDIVRGQTYRYQVQALGPPPHRSDICGTATVTTVPEFPTLVAGALAVVASVGAYTWSRRRV